MKLTFYCILIFFISCKEKETVKEEDNQITKVHLPIVSKTNNEKHLIKVIGVDEFIIGKKLPYDLNHYKFLKTTKTVEETIEEPVVKVISETDTLVEISFNYDYEKELFTDKISEINILNKMYKTNKDIRVGSTISEFTEKYKDYKLWFTYISQRFIIESKDKKNIQFELCANGYIGKKDLMDGDMVKLELKDFKKETKIVSIRIFNFN